MRPIADDWRPCDIGYSMMGVHVGDFDAALDRLRRTSGRLLGAPHGPRGARRVCLRDPDGILLELMEDDFRLPGSPAPVRADVASAARFVRLSVPDLDRASRFWVEALGLTEARDVCLHTPEHETLWGLPRASARRLLLWAGDFLVELVEYTDPVGRDRPAGYLMSDQGILNVAFGSIDRHQFDAMLRRVRAAGYEPINEPWELKGVASVVYVYDDQGFNVELLHVEPGGCEQMGFLPAADAYRAEKRRGAR
jgi:catechol 2,3-dioxygenase-like lactoylglutathione lyase family enzyme